MARPIPSISNHHHLQFSSVTFSSFFVIIAAFSIFSLVTFLCASNRTKKSKQSQRNFVSKMNSNISCKAISMVKMISWRKVEAAEEEDEEEVRDLSDEEVWRKTIIKGERCRPLDFSGKIDYDSEGNLLSDSPHSKDKSKALA